MKKISIIALFGIGIFFSYISLPQQTTISTSLSERAQEYIAGKKAQADTALNEVNFEYPQKIAMDNVLGEQSERIQNDCYSIEIPFVVKRKNIVDECTIQLFIEKPKVHIVITHREMGTKSIDDISDIQLRRANKEKYSEKSEVVHDTHYTIFIKQGFEYEKTAFVYIHGNMISITLSAPSNRDLDKEFTQLLASFRYFL